MKKTLLFCILISVTLLGSQTAHCQSVDEFTEQFEEEYEALKPRESSSVGADYVFRQTALAAKYTTKILNLLYHQNQEFLAKYDEILNKYDEIIQQNNEIIKLLSELGEKDKME